jgi:hypothetical protein
MPPRPLTTIVLLLFLLFFYTSGNTHYKSMGNNFVSHLLLRWFFAKWQNCYFKLCNSLLSNKFLSQATTSDHPSVVFSLKLILKEGRLGWGPGNLVVPKKSVSHLSHCVPFSPDLLLLALSRLCCLPDMNLSKKLSPYHAVEAYRVERG